MHSLTRTSILGSSLSFLIVAPMIAHLVWRPLALALDGPLTGVAFPMSLAAVGVAALAAGVLCWRLAGADAARSARSAWAVVALVATLSGALVGGVAGAVSLLSVGAAALVVLPRMVAALSATLARLPAPSSFRLGVWCLTAVLAVGSSVKMATYFGDPEATAFAGSDRVLLHHFCATSYVHGAELVLAGVDNPYDLELAVPTGAGPEALPPSAAHMAPFELDRYGYPPQFLLFPMAVLGISADFTAFRAIWTCLNAIFVGFFLWHLGLWVGPRSGRLLRAIAPLLWLISGIVYQTGNIHLVVFGIGMLAMQAFHARRDTLGGALLAWATLAKIAPGLLGVLLLMRRRWAATAWTVAFAVFLSLVSLVAMGTGVFESFIHYHLPMISSGEGYDFLDDDRRHIYENLAPFSLPFKLAELGVALDPWVWGPRVASVYTLSAFVLTALAGRLALDRRGHVSLWALVLTFAGLRSPMAAGYVMFGVMLSLALAAVDFATAKDRIAGALVAAAMLFMMPQFSFLPMWVPIAAQAVMHAGIVWLLFRSWPSLDEHLPAQLLGRGQESRGAA
jgi:hypothetical protein